MNRFTEFFRPALINTFKDSSSENQPDDHEIPEISQALERYQELKELVDNKFVGYKIRQTITKPEVNKLYITLAKPDDLQKQNPPT